MTAHDAEELVARKKDLDDNPVPSGNSMLAFVLLRLARIYGDDELEHRAVGVLRLLHANLEPDPVRVRLGAVRARPVPVAAARAGDRRRAGATRSPARALAPFDPNAVVAFGPGDEVPLLAGKTRVDGKPTLYECERFACRAPVT